ncbi:PQQ-like beta-propeller repeat protein [Isoptericola sp. 4D.3]|uniref:PQQ-like beta-propeller repeat protein n=1 Tax=Isoptericola peretonis TaxID=2918523 RepID=A0ABT0IZN1_9MICO|nr:PQQ-like beta-propeller repeat protein [Isoptericola sp. 4D.3]
MPPRFRRPEPMTTFELVPDDEQDDGHGLVAPGGDDGRGATARLAGLRGRVTRRWRALSRRGRAAIAAGIAVVVLAATTAAVAPGLLDARDQRLRAEAVRGTPGAVGDLSEPLAETWSLAHGDGALVTLPGGTVLTTEGTEVSAIDAGTGREVWRRDLGPSLACGPRANVWDVMSRPSAVVVCLSGEADARTATVLDADGAVVGERSLGPARTDGFGDAPEDGAPLVVPAAAGAVAVVDGITDATARWPADDQPDADTLRELRAAGWTDPVVRVEDALTGEVRGEATLRLRPEHLEGCGMMQDEGTAPELTVEPTVSASPEVTVFSACSAAVYLTPDGATLDVDPADGWVHPLPDGGLLRVAGEESTVLDDDGSVLATVPGFLLPPTVDDDPHGSFLVLTGVGDDAAPMRLASVGPEGEEDWTATTADLGGVLARVAGTVVVQDGAGLVAFDAASGAEVWTHGDLLRRTADGSGDWVVGAVTDGTRLLVGINGDGAGHRLAALDLRDGTTAWQREREGFLEGLQSVGGNVVVFDGVVRGLGQR